MLRYSPQQSYIYHRNAASLVRGVVRFYLEQYGCHGPHFCAVAAADISSNVTPQGHTRIRYRKVPNAKLWMSTTRNMKVTEKLSRCHACGPLSNYHRQYVRAAESILFRNRAHKLRAAETQIKTNTTLQVAEEALRGRFDNDTSLVASFEAIVVRTNP